MPFSGMRRHGFTLLELAIVLALLATLFTAAAPAFARGRDVLAVRAARAELASAVAAARSHAILVGGAQLVIDPAGTLSIARAGGGGLSDPIDLATRYGVSLDTPGQMPVLLRYDALGIGRMTNATLHIRRGDLSAAIVISAYGRVRL